MGAQLQRMQLLYAPMQLIAAHLQLISTPIEFPSIRYDVGVENRATVGARKPTKPIGIVGVVHNLFTTFSRYNGKK